MELPILLGRMRRLLVLNILDTAISIGLLLLGAYWSLEAAAASRIAYGLAWWFIYAWLLRDLIGLKWLALLDVYARSLAVSAAAVAPVTLAYVLVAPPESLPVTWLIASVAAGALAWFGALFVVRHPVREEIGAFIAHLIPARAARTAIP
jgi:hypothetical protein